jgi:hypothetical protein
MTPLEQHLMQMDWCHCDRNFTTIYKGFGFVIFRDQHQMWLAGLDKDEVTFALDCHNTKPPEITCFMQHEGVGGTKRLFEIPAAPELVSAAMASAFPELQLGQYPIDHLETT